MLKHPFMRGVFLICEKCGYLRGHETMDDLQEFEKLTLGELLDLKHNLRFRISEHRHYVGQLEIFLKHIEKRITEISRIEDEGRKVDQK